MCQFHTHTEVKGDYDTPAVMYQQEYLHGSEDKMHACYHSEKINKTKELPTSDLLVLRHPQVNALGGFNVLVLRLVLVLVRRLRLSLA